MVYTVYGILQARMLREAHWLKPSTLAMHHSNHLTNCFIIGGSGKEHRTNKPPLTGRVQERSKGDTTCPTTSQNPSLWYPSWLNKAGTTRKYSESEWLAKDNPETNPMTIKPDTASHVAEQFSWVLLSYCSPPRCPFPIKSLALSALVSPQTIHFWVLAKSPVSGPGRGPLSCNKNSGVGSLYPLQGIFPTQVSNTGLPHCGQILYQLSHKGSPLLDISSNILVA